MPKKKPGPKRAKEAAYNTPSRLVASSLGVHAKALAIDALHETMVSNQIGQPLAIPGCNWYVTVFPNKFFIQGWMKKEPLLEIVFDLPLEPIPDRFEVELDLKKGQIVVEAASGSAFLRWRLYSNEALEPIFELMKLKGKGHEKALMVFYNEESCQWIPRQALNLRQKEGSTHPRLPQGLEAQLWLGTHRKLDWRVLSSLGAQKEAIGAWMHQWTLALRWIDPMCRDSELVEELRRYLVVENESFMKRWWQLAVASSLGPMVPVSSFSFTPPRCLLHVLDKPMAWMQAMGEVVWDRWVKMQEPATYLLDAEVSSKSPSGRAHIQGLKGVHLKWRWRANRTDLIYLEALESKLASLQLRPLPKRARLTRFSMNPQGTSCREVKLLEACKNGKFLDVELVEGTHYLLDRFEY